MDVAAAMAAQGARHGTVIGADTQTAGRGRRGASWSSPPGAGLYVSVITRPAASQIPLLTLAAGVGVRDGVAAATGLAADLKWPNDLIVGARKLAGILAEGISIGTPAQAVVIGVGINVQPAAYPPEVAARATSLEGELGRPVDVQALLSRVLSTLWLRLAQLDDDPSAILQAWRAASPNARGTRVEWDDREGVTAGIDDTGALIVDTPAGAERVIAGELRWHL